MDSSLPDGFILDNSIVPAWAFADEHDPYADAILAALPCHTAYVPSLWLWEITNALVIGERRGRITLQAAIDFLSDVADLPIQVLPSPPVQTLPARLLLGHQQRLTGYDAEYLMLALQTGRPLATSDGELIAAMARLEVERFEP